MPLQPELVARFDTDPQGNPRFAEDDKKKHYKIVFEIQNAPPDAYWAQFELDPTGYDPVRTVQADEKGKLVLETTAFGDHPVKVTLHKRDGEFVEVLERPSQALDRARSEMPQNPMVDQAISDIKAT